MKPIKAIVLAAGKGTRLHSAEHNQPKALREAAGKPLLYYVLSALDFLPKENTVIVAGYMREQVEARFPDYPFAVQDPQLGTGHAVQCARDYLRDFDGTVLVCCGDMPLLKKETYQALLNAHEQSGNPCTFLTGTTELNLPFGRILRDENGFFLRVVEDKDCTPEQKNIRELNAGVYAFDCQELLACLELLKNDNAQQVEGSIYEMWQKGGYFHAKKDPDKKPWNAGISGYSLRSSAARSGGISSPS